MKERGETIVRSASRQEVKTLSIRELAIWPECSYRYHVCVGCRTSLRASLSCSSFQTIASEVERA